MEEKLGFRAEEALFSRVVAQNVLKLSTKKQTRERLDNCWIREALSRSGPLSRVI